MNNIHTRIAFAIMLSTLAGFAAGRVAAATFHPVTIFGNNTAWLTVDGDPDTWWASTSAGVSIRYDLGAERSLESVTLNWENDEPTVSSHIFSIQVADTFDGDWNTVIDTVTADGPLTQTFPFAAAVDARYLRYIHHGHTGGVWGRLNEATITGSAGSGFTTRLIGAATATDSNNTAGAIFDGDFHSQWETQTIGATLTVDFGQVEMVEAALLAWLTPQRTKRFLLEYSTDGLTWTDLLEYDSSNPYTASSIDFQRFTFENIIDAQYFRYTNFGNSANNWVNLTQVEFVSFIPEPTSLLLLAAAASIMLTRRRRVQSSPRQSLPENPIPLDSNTL